jgi:molybdate transport system ATP-binding protein
VDVAVTLELTTTVPGRGFSASLRVAQGETVAVLGPNGAGKSTLLGVIAGLVRPGDGAVELAGRTLSDTAGGIWIPPHRRQVSLLAQEPLLFPHLSVLDNVAFGPRSAGAPTRQARETARAWLAEVDASDLADRRPASLSGGQAQRIAVARALASEPQLLLLDEPFAALDVAVAPALRRMLRRVLADRSVVIVTHDVLDAFTLADRVVVMHNGLIVEEGPTRDVLLQPRTRFTAELTALNLLTGIRTETGMRLTGTDVELAAAASADFPLGAAAAMAVRPSAVTLSTTDPSRAGLNVVRGTVHDIEPRGDVVRVRGSIAGGVILSADVLPSVVVDLDLDLGVDATPGLDLDVTADAARSAKTRPGTAAPLYFAFDPAAASLYPGLR